MTTRNAHTSTLVWTSIFVNGRRIRFCAMEA